MHDMDWKTTVATVFTHMNSQLLIEMALDEDCNGWAISDLLLRRLADDGQCVSKSESRKAQQDLLDLLFSLESWSLRKKFRECAYFAVCYLYKKKDGYEFLVRLLSDSRFVSQDSNHDYLHKGAIRHHKNHDIHHLVATHANLVLTTRGLQETCELASSQANLNLLQLYSSHPALQEDTPSLTPYLTQCIPEVLHHVGNPTATTQEILEILEFLLNDLRVELAGTNNAYLFVAAQTTQVEIMKRLLQDPRVVPVGPNDEAFELALEMGDAHVREMAFEKYSVGLFQKMFE
ncbi:UNVERIFIED_CONTAM: hypothetical protein HDU68_000859 [Siphonaria sp. JEL0065]|nr:hypothetical protein HDU68_000859 [Siphonaria sp. JEL0065]